MFTKRKGSSPGGSRKSSPRSEDKTSPGREFIIETRSKSSPRSDSSIEGKIKSRPRSEYGVESNSKVSPRREYLETKSQSSVAKEGHYERHHKTSPDSTMETRRKKSIESHEKSSTQIREGSKSNDESNEQSLESRPKRTLASSKLLDDSTGLSWREATDLKKALYASLQESRRKSRTAANNGGDEEPEMPILTPEPKPQIPKLDKFLTMPLDLKVSNTNHANNNSNNGEGNSNDSSKSSSISATQESKAKIHAQRKFAQGSLPSTPVTTPVKYKTSPLKLFPKRAKTEDFLTFLCLRGSSSLPPHLDFFKYAMNDEFGTGDVGRFPIPCPAGKSDPATRESTPESMYTLSNYSNVNEDSNDTVTLRTSIRTPSKKAARACASAPETARGRAGMPVRSRKKVVTKPTVRTLRHQKDAVRSYEVKRPVTRKESRLVPLRSSTSARQVTSEHLMGTRLKGVSSGNSTKSKKGVSVSNILGRRKRGRRNDDESADRSLRRNTAVASKRKVALRTKGAQSGSTDSEVSIPKTSLDDSGISSPKAPRLTPGISSPKAPRLTPGISSPKVPRLTPGASVLLKSSRNMRRMHSDSKIKQSVKGANNKRVSKTAKVVRQLRKSTALKRKMLENSDAMKASSEGISSSKFEKERVLPFKLRKPTKRKQIILDTDDDSESDESFIDVGTPSRISNRPPSFARKVHATRPAQSIKRVTKFGGVKQTATLKWSTKKRQTILKRLRPSASTDQRNLSQMVEKRRDRKMISYKEDSDSEPCMMANSGKLRRRGRLSSVSSPEDQARTQKVFPTENEPSRLVDIPIYYPTEKEFHDPLTYIKQIREHVEPYGMCKIVPPASWKFEGKVNEELRFTSQMQYIHKMMQRWGTNVQHVSCIKKHLSLTAAKLDQTPLVGGIELDLCKLYYTIKEFGGMQNVIDKKKWMKVADAMKIPKLAQDRGTRLYDAYCKYLLSYDMLSIEEKLKLEQQVFLERQKCEEPDECVIKGKSTSISSFIRAARNTMSMWLKDDCSPDQVESEFWQIVGDRSSHVAVQCGHVNSGTQSSVFPTKRDNPYTKHGWNLNMLAQNPQSVFRNLGPVPGVNVPTLHVGMLFTSSCWSTDIHLTPYVQYLHSGANVIWYSIPHSQESKFKAAMKEIVPTLVENSPRWLKEDTVMVSPDILIKKGVSVGRCIQKQHEFVVVFPQAYTATINCGYSLSESVHFATPEWISLGCKAAEHLHQSQEPELFSMEELLTAMCRNDKTDETTLQDIIPLLEKYIEKEISHRKQLHDAGLKNTKRMCVPDDITDSVNKRKRSLELPSENDNVCEVLKKQCYFSMVVNESDDTVFSLEHLVSHAQSKRSLKSCRLLYRFTETELKDILKVARDRLPVKKSPESQHRTRFPNRAKLFSP